MPCKTADTIFGHMELVQFTQFEGGRMVNYGYAIHFDRSGIEVSRTDPTRYGSIGWDDGTPFTREDAEDLESTPQFK